MSHSIKRFTSRPVLKYLSLYFSNRVLSGIWRQACIYSGNPAGKLKIKMEAVAPSLILIIILISKGKSMNTNVWN